jgi:hypothetical protein
MSSHPEIIAMFQDKDTKQAAHFETLPIDFREMLFIKARIEITKNTIWAEFSPEEKQRVLDIASDIVRSGRYLRGLADNA